MVSLMNVLWMHSHMNKQMDEYTDGWMGWMDGQMDGFVGVQEWLGGWIYRQTDAI